MPHLKIYHRPDTVDDALQLLADRGVTTQLIAGGTHAVPSLGEMAVDAVVDLQGVQDDRLHEITLDGEQLTIGALTRLQEIVDDERLPDLLRQTARQEGPNTHRHSATIGGLIVGADSESELVATLLVFDAVVTVQRADGLKTIPLTDFLQNISSSLQGGILTTVALTASGQTSSARVARTPADRPIVAAVARRGEDGRMRIAVCGIADTPCLVNPEKLEETVSHQGDFRGSRAYRQQIAAVLVERVLEGGGG